MTLCRSTAGYLALLALAIALATGAHGLITGTERTQRAGIFLGMAAGTAVLALQQSALAKVTEEQLAAARRRGYRQALDHVARGLLDPTSTGPTTPSHARHDDTDLTERRLYAVASHHPPERHAQ